MKGREAESGEKRLLVWREIEIFAGSMELECGGSSFENFEIWIETKISKNYLYINKYERKESLQARFESRSNEQDFE